MTDTPHFELFVDATPTNPLTGLFLPLTIEQVLNLQMSLRKYDAEVAYDHITDAYAELGASAIVLRGRL